MPKLCNINDFTRLYRRTVKVSVAAALTVKVKLNRIAPGKVRVLTHVTVENTSVAYDLCRLAIDHGGILHYLDELQNIAANELAVSRSPILLGEGDVFFSELTGTNPLGNVIMTCIGWEQDL